MELGITIIGLAAVATFAVPLMIMDTGRKNKGKSLLKGLNALASTHQSDVATFDRATDFAIGISAAKDNVFYYKQRHERIVEQCIPLHTIGQCKVEMKTRTIKSHHHTDTLTEKLELVFLPTDKNSKPARFEFFTSEELFQLNGELQLARKWEGIINTVIVKK